VSLSGSFPAASGNGAQLRCKRVLHVDVAEVKKWLEDKVPGTYSALRAQYPNAEIHFQFWTTGNFKSEAVLFLEEAQLRLRRYKVGYKVESQVRSYVATLQSASLTKMLDEHYFNHPISRVNKKYDAPPSPTEVSLVFAKIGD
jgi:hypothetical protein